MKNKLYRWIEQAWERNAAWLCILIPFSWIYRAGSYLHKSLYRSHLLKTHSFQKPVIVVGNILSGGVGKTPLVMAIAHFYESRGKRVGIISRGYGNSGFIGRVRLHDSPYQTGDEPLILAQSTKAIVWVDPNRSQGIQMLFEQLACDIVISDDGLQHYALKPRYRIVVHPSQYAGSPSCLPAGPFRENLKALSQYDYRADPRVWNQTAFLYIPAKNKTVYGDDIGAILRAENHLTLLTAIARPERLMDFLKLNQIAFQEKIFPDHHFFQFKEVCAIQGAILMTEKDWVKYKLLNLKNKVYIISYRVILPENLCEVLCEF